MAVSNGFTYTQSGGNATITDYDPASSSYGYAVTIPTTLDTYPVIAIAANAFKAKSLTSVTFDHVVNLDDECFANNSGLDITLNANVTTTVSTLVPPFEGCSVGAGLTITSSVTTIATILFHNCGLTALTIPSSVTTINSYAFSNNSITALELNYATLLKDACFANNSGIDVTLNANVTTSFVTTMGFDGCAIGSGLTITSNVTTIPDKLFRNSGLTSLTIPSSVTTINQYAFSNNSITALELNYATLLKDACFASNSGMGVTINANVTIAFTSTSPFNSCSLSAGLIITSSVTSIPNSLFRDCGLTSIILPNSITTIGNNTFSHNANLATFKNFNSSTTYGTNVLYGCMSAESKGTIYGIDESTTDTWWTANYTSTYNWANLGSPAAPTDIILTRNSDTSQTISWTNNSTESNPYEKLEIERWDSDSEIWSALDDNLANSIDEYTDTTTIANRKYKYRVRAYNYIDYSSYLTSDYWSTTPAAPTEISGVVSGNTIVLSWTNNAQAADSGTVQRKVYSGGSWGAYSDYDTTAGNAVEYIDNAPENTTMYRVRFNSTSPELNSSWLESEIIVFGIKTYDCKIELLQYEGFVQAEAGTDSDTIIITGHGLSDNDFIVNTTLRSNYQTISDRACRRIQATDENTLTCEALVDQEEDDIISLYKFNDITSYVLLNTVKLALVAESENELSFDMIIDTDSITGPEMSIKPGMYVRAKIDEAVYFLGMISKAKYKIAGIDSKLIYTITCIPLKNRATSRNVLIYYAAGTTSKSIVEDMLVFLKDEGIEAGTIDTGISLDELWSSDCISIYEVIDELCSKNEFMWYIDENFKLHFTQDSYTNAEESLIQGGSFIDFRDVEIDYDILEQANKVHFIGGTDSDGNDVFVIQGNGAEQEDYCGSGVYGVIERNSSITDKTDYTAEAATTATNLNVTGIGLVVQEGDYLKNRTRGIGMFVILVDDDNNLSTTSVASQTSGDSIVYYPTANLICRNVLKRQSYQPCQLKFHTYNLSFKPQQKLNVDIMLLGLPDRYFNIERVEISDAGRGYFNAIVTAVYRDETNYSSQRRKNTAIDFFKKF